MWNSLLSSSTYFGLQDLKTTCGDLSGVNIDRRTTGFLIGFKGALCGIIGGGITRFLDEVINERNAGFLIGLLLSRILAVTRCVLLRDSKLGINCVTVFIMLLNNS